MPNNSKHTLLYICSISLLIMLLTACNKRTVYYHYEHTPLTGWERNDTISFVVGPIGEDGLYEEEVGLRITGEYPFMGLNMIVEQQLASTQEKHCDTLVCDLVNDHGTAKGAGVSQYQYMFRLPTLELQAGEKLFVAIRHDMKREILPGISDIGVKVSRK
ncbi:MAG: gliding motility lipoprotein GldH [Prevotella sp.]|nr:gliding motility lipoprotein GldH [Prevotella sp.]MBR0270329.1 gliding motility lipoprotein GldH [Prevotella sp.]